NEYLHPLNKLKDTLKKSLEIIEAGHCRIAFPKENSLRVTAIGLHLNTYRK
ncbi:6306_t:CDS:1, partial [Gigaspora rosea]